MEAFVLHQLIGVLLYVAQLAVTTALEPDPNTQPPAPVAEAVIIPADGAHLSVGPSVTLAQRID